MKSIIIVTIVLCLYAFFRELCQPSALNNFNKDYAIRLRGILCIMIVLHHTSYIDSDMRGWGAPVVDVFMFMSGYGLMKSYMAKGIAYLKDSFIKGYAKFYFHLYL